MKYVCIKSKYFIGLLFCLIMLFSFFVCTSNDTYAQNVQNNNLGVIIDGSVRSFDNSPIIINNRVWVPMRNIFEDLGAYVVYYKGNIFACTEDKFIDLDVDSSVYSIGDFPYYGMFTGYDLNPPMSKVAMLHQGITTYVPIRLIAETFGCTVNWDGRNVLITINDKVKQLSSVNISNFYNTYYVYKNTNVPCLSYYLPEIRLDNIISNTVMCSVNQSSYDMRRIVNIFEQCGYRPVYVGFNFNDSVLTGMYNNFDFTNGTNTITLEIAQYSNSNRILLQMRNK